MQKVRYESLAQAIGAFVAGEFEACVAEPNRLMLEGEERVWCNPEMRTFETVLFEEHLDGLLSDLVDLCMYPPEGVEHIGFDGKAHKGPVIVVYATDEEVRAGEPMEWQACAQGYAHLQALGS